jgi:hypothetical protein
MKAMVWRALACMVAALALGANLASAAPIPVNISYDFTSGSLPAGNAYTNGVISPNPYSLTAPSLAASAAATPATFGLSITPGSVALTPSAQGLGIGYSGNLFGFMPANDTNPGNIDGFGAREALNLTLGAASPHLSNFKLASITLGNIANGLLIDDDVMITVNGVDYLIDPNTNPWFVFEFDQMVTYDLSALNIAINPGDTISIWAPGGNDDFTVAGISFSAISTPEPTSLAVWSVLAIGGVLYGRRRMAARA